MTTHGWFGKLLELEDIDHSKTLGPQFFDDEEDVGGGNPETKHEESEDALRTEED